MRCNNITRVYRCRNPHTYSYLQTTRIIRKNAQWILDVMYYVADKHRGHVRKLILYISVSVWPHVDDFHTK